MSSNGLPLDEAGIVSTSLESILYGFSVFMFSITMWVLLGNKKRQNLKSVNWNMVVVSCVLCALSTAHVIVDIIRIYEGLVELRQSFPGGPPAFFADVAQKTFVVKNAIYTLQTLLGDGVVIYRCYVVWQSFWVIILPLMGWCGVAASGVGSVYAVSQASAHSTDIFFQNTGRWITSFYASTFSTNLLSTGLLAYRIWTINRNASPSRTSKHTLLPVLLIVIDAGVLYSVTLLAALICFVRSSNGQYVVLDMVCPIISIAFYMIIIRVGLQRKTITSPHSTVPSSSTGRTLRSEQYPLQVHITKLSQSEIEHSSSSLSKDRCESDTV